MDSQACVGLKAHARVPDLLTRYDFGKLFRKMIVVNWLGDKSGKAQLLRSGNGGRWLGSRNRDNRCFIELRHAPYFFKDVVAGDTSRQHQIENNQINLVRVKQAAHGVPSPALEVHTGSVNQQRHLENDTILNIILD